MTIKTGDNIRVIVGKDKGKEGKVLQVFPKLGRVVVEGVNLSTRHLRSRGKGTAGQKIRFPAPIHHSNLQVLSKGGKTGRVGYKLLTQGEKETKIRVLHSKGVTEDLE